MSNGHDHPGEYRVTPAPTSADVVKSVAELQEQDGYLLVAMNQNFMVFYKETH